MGSARRLIVASRGSKLALKQAEIISRLLEEVDPSIEIEVRTVRTTGDKDSRPYSAIGGRGLFVAEVEKEVAEGRCDVAVHSAKDLTSQLAPGCRILCVPARGAVHDVVVGGASGATGEERLAALAPGSVVGTSSMRRRALIAELRPDIDVTDLRGNLETRLRKVAEGVIDAAVLAAAGIERLGGTEEVAPAPLDVNRWVPAPGQGALAVQALIDRSDLDELFSQIDDATAHSEVVCERAFAERMEGGCSVPLGCVARADGGALVATGFLGHPLGHDSLRDRISGAMEGAEQLGRELADAILDAGGDEILAELRSFEPPPVESP